MPLQVCLYPVPYNNMEKECEGVMREERSKENVLADCELYQCQMLIVTIGGVRKTSRYLRVTLPNQITSCAIVEN